MLAKRKKNAVKQKKRNNAETEKVFSFCNRCGKEIELGKEIQIEDLINCKGCFQQVIARCHRCSRPIYKDDLVREINPNWSAENVFGISQSEKIIHCNWCYQKWLIERKKKSRWQNQRNWFLGICSTVVLSLVFFLLYPKLEKNWIKLVGEIGENNYRPRKPWIVCICSLVLSSVIVFFLYSIISIDFISRYNGRKTKKLKKLMRWFREIIKKLKNKIMKAENNKNNNKEKKPEDSKNELGEKIFCSDCGFGYKKGQMVERKDKKWFCLRCAPRNQL